MVSPKYRFLVMFGVFCFFLSCVTVNVYFPAKEVEKKAGDIVDDIRKMPPASDPPGRPQSVLPGIQYGIGWEADRAYAQTTPDSPAVQALKRQMGERFTRLRPFFQKGALGEGYKGFLELRDGGSLSPGEQQEVRRLVDAENRDRQVLYQEVAKSMNITPDQSIKVQRIFADKWQQSSAPGWWIQKEDGRWMKKN